MKINAKVGDKLICSRFGGWMHSTFMAEVVRLTPAQIFTKRYRFRKSDGRGIGEKVAIVRVATDRDVKEQHLQKALSRAIYKFTSLAGKPPKFITENIELIINNAHAIKAVSEKINNLYEDSE